MKAKYRLPVQSVNMYVGIFDGPTKILYFFRADTQDDLQNPIVLNSYEHPISEEIFMKLTGGKKIPSVLIGHNTSTNRVYTGRQTKGSRKWDPKTQKYDPKSVIEFNEADSKYILNYIIRG